MLYLVGLVMLAGVLLFCRRLSNYKTKASKALFNCLIFICCLISSILICSFSSLLSGMDMVVWINSFGEIGSDLIALTILAISFIMFSIWVCEIGNELNLLREVTKGARDKKHK